MAQAGTTPSPAGAATTSGSSGTSGTPSTDWNAANDSTIGNYKKMEDLGVGGYSRVILASNVTNNKLVAIKVLLSEPKKIINDVSKQIERIEWSISESKIKQCRREMELMRAIEHDNVVKLVDVIEGATFPQKDELRKELVGTPCLCVVLEYCSRGELFDYLMYAGGLGSRVTRTYFHQFLNGLQAMHDANYVHRDLKPENLLLDDNYNLKIADFGFATPFKDQNGKIQLTTTCGTRGYLAPELIRGEKYTNKVDLFAMGIIMFTTFAGFPPFQHAGRGDWWWDKMNKAWDYWAQATTIQEDTEVNKNRKKERIQKGNAKMKLFWQAHERTCRFSDTFKHLMQYLLNPNPGIRYDIEACRNHTWLKGKTLNQRNLRKQMRKLYDKVTKQRAAKIAEQLKQRNMQPQVTSPSKIKRGKSKDKDQEPTPRVIKVKKWEETPPDDMFIDIAEPWLPTLTNDKDERMLTEQIAMLKKARFQFKTRVQLAKIIETIDRVSRKYQSTPKQDNNKCEYIINGRILHTDSHKQKYDEPERLVVKVKFLYEKIVKPRMDADDEDYKDDLDNDDEDIAPDSDDEVEEAKLDDTPVQSSSGTKDSGTQPDVSSNDSERWIVVFWRAQGSAIGFQTLMSQVFYDHLMTSLIDTSDILEGLTQTEINKIINDPIKKRPVAMDNALNVRYDNSAAESEELPEVLPNI